MAMPGAARRRARSDIAGTRVPQADTVIIIVGALESAHACPTAQRTTVSGDCGTGHRTHRNGREDGLRALGELIGIPRLRDAPLIGREQMLRRHNDLTLEHDLTVIPRSRNGQGTLITVDRRQLLWPGTADCLATLDCRHRRTECGLPGDAREFGRSPGAGGSLRPGDAPACRETGGMGNYCVRGLNTHSREASPNWGNFYGVSLAG